MKTKITTVGQLKATSGAIFVWCMWQGNDGDYFPVARTKFIAALSDPADHAIVFAEQRLDGNIYVN